MATVEQGQGQGQEQEQDLEAGFGATRRVLPQQDSPGSGDGQDPMVVDVTSDPFETEDYKAAYDNADSLKEMPVLNMPKYLRDEAIRVTEANYPGDLEEQKRIFKAYDRKVKEIIESTQNDIDGPGAFNIDLVVPKTISEPQLREFFGNVLDQYSEFARASTESDYALKPRDWFESKSNRARLVLIESTNDNLQDIAKAMLNASPLERIVAVGLDQEKQAALRTALLESWEEKIKNHAPHDENRQNEYRQKVLEALKEKPENPIVALEEQSLEALMGPNDLTTRADISHANLQQELGGTYDSKIDEIILYGESEALAQGLPALLVDAKIQQSLAVKATPFSDSNNSLFWTMAPAKAPAIDPTLEPSMAPAGADDPIKRITDGKNPGVIIEEGRYQLNPDFEKIFNDHIKENDIHPRDAAFLKEMFTSNSLYLNNLSPALYATTITKAQSGVNGKGALVVGKALPWALIGRIIATAFGARFAVNSTMLDTGNDLQQGDQEKMLSYKDLYRAVLANELKKNPENAFKEALAQLTKGFSDIESNQEISKIEIAAAAGRLHSLIHANKTNKLNERGISLLWPSPGFWLFGLGATVSGVVLAAKGIGLGIGAPATGAGVYATAFAVSAASLGYQAVANAYNFVRWHRASGKARGTQKNAQDKRQINTAELTEKLVKQDQDTSETLQNQESQGLSREQSVQRDMQLAASTGQEQVSQETPALLAQGAGEVKVMEPEMEHPSLEAAPDIASPMAVATEGVTPDEAKTEQEEGLADLMGQAETQAQMEAIIERIIHGKTREEIAAVYERLQEIADATHGAQTAPELAEASEEKAQEPDQTRQPSAVPTTTPHAHDPEVAAVMDGIVTIVETEEVVAEVLEEMTTTIERDAEKEPALTDAELDSILEEVIEESGKAQKAPQGAQPEEEQTTESEGKSQRQSAHTGQSLAGLQAPAQPLSSPGSSEGPPTLDALPTQNPRRERSSRKKTNTP